jgi:hypothetical protein
MSPRRAVARYGKERIMSTVRLQVAPRVGPVHPRGAQLAVMLWLALRRALGAWKRPAAPAMAPSDAEREARAVRELALQYRHTDPAFAADLLAAADRHERQHGIQ